MELVSLSEKLQGVNTVNPLSCRNAEFLPFNSNKSSFYPISIEKHIYHILHIHTCMFVLLCMLKIRKLTRGLQK